MKIQSIIAISNKVALAALLVLVYWLFSYLFIETFDLKVFEKYLSTSYYIIIFGVLALLFGIGIINIMLNLTRIANEKEGIKTSATSNKYVFWIILGLFPIILILLFQTDYQSSKNKEKVLLESSTNMVEGATGQLLNLPAYSFDKTWLEDAKTRLKISAASNVHYTQVILIVKDTINDMPVFLSFDRYSSSSKEKLVKSEYLFALKESEKKYLYRVFEEGLEENRFQKKGNSYELFLPFKKEGKTMVLYCSEWQRYKFKR